MTKGTTKRNSPGSKTHFVVYAAALTALYFWSTPEITGNFTQSQERGFYVAAVRQSSCSFPCMSFPP